jgi:hypothetical protein
MIEICFLVLTLFQPATLAEAPSEFNLARGRVLASAVCPDMTPGEVEKILGPAPIAWTTGRCLVHEYHAFGLDVIFFADGPDQKIRLVQVVCDKR